MSAGTCGMDAGLPDTGGNEGGSCIPPDTNCYMVPENCCSGSCTFDMDGGGYFCQ
jgi:hypothetical protein